MKLEQVHISQIKSAFEKMQSREDLLHLLNEAKPLVYGEKAVPFELKQLTWYTNPKLGTKRYAEFKIRKKSGAERSIHAPVRGLKSLQKVLSFVLQCVYEPHHAAMGFVRDKSIVDNAKVHVAGKYVYNIDLKDFFPSIDQARLWKCFQLRPFNLNKLSSAEPLYMSWEDFEKEILKTEKSVNFLKGKGRMFAKTPFGTLYVANNFDKEKDKYILFGSSSLKTKGGKSLEGTLWMVNKIPDTSRLDIANILASLCCTEMEVERKNEAGEWKTIKRNVLPQGAPTSPVITNIVCQRLDYVLSGVAKRFGLKYSRYADDITFSSMHNVYQPESDFLKELHRIITEQGFHMKESKTRLQKDGYRKEVTGLLVNEKANVQKRYIKQLRMWLYYWEAYGYERAYGFFLQQYVVEKGHIIKGKPDMTNVIAGKLDYLKMVKGNENDLYLKLKGRFHKLIRLANPINRLLDIWENEGIIKLWKYTIKTIRQMNKYDFIADLLEKEKLDSSQKERVLKLIVNELKADGINQIEIKERVKQIEQKLSPQNLLVQQVKNVTNSSIQTDLPNYMDPTQLSKFLRAYNEDSMLKYTCHEIDKDGLITINEKCGTETFSLGKYQEQLTNLYKDRFKQYSIPKSIWALINGYLNGGKEWSSDKIKVNWRSTELLEWSKNNTGVVPNPDNGIVMQTGNLGFDFSPFRSKIFETTIGSFSQLVIHFKNLFHIRADNSLKRLIENVNTVNGWNNQIDFIVANFRDNVEFFTDVDKLLQAYKKIIKIVLEVSERHNLAKPRVELLLNEVDDVVFFSIHHKNSTYKKTIKNTIERTGQKHTELIKNQINGVCNLYIQADFENNEFARINLWNGEERKAEMKDKFSGVEYQLIFK